MSTADGIPRPAVAGVLGALGYLGGALVQAVDPLRPGDPGFVLRNVASTAFVLLLVGAVVGLALAPLLCAVYPVAASPLFGLAGMPGHLAVAGWGACWLALAVVLLRPVRTPRRQGVRL